MFGAHGAIRIATNARCLIGAPFLYGHRMVQWRAPICEQSSCPVALAYASPSTVSDLCKAHTMQPFLDPIPDSFEPILASGNTLNDMHVIGQCNL